MHWHLQPILAIARGYPNPAGTSDKDCFKREVEFAAVATVHLLGGGRAHIVGHLRSGEPIRQREYRELLDQLRDNFGVHDVTWKHAGEDETHDTKPAPL